MPKIVTVEGCPVLVKYTDVDRSKVLRFKPKSRKKTFDYGIKRLSKRQQDALANVMNAGAVDRKTKRQAGIDAGYAKTYAIQGVEKALERKSIIEALERHNVTDDKIAQVIAGGLEAMHPLTKGKQPDWHARDKFVKEANRIKDNYPPTRVKGQLDVRSVQVHLTTEDYRASEKYAKMRGENAEA
jgi:hypothetical protein